MILKRNEKTIYLIEASLFGALIAFGFFAFRATEVFKSYYLIVILAVLCIITCAILGWKKNRNFLNASALRFVITFCLLFGIISYALGLILGFNLSHFSLKIGDLFVGLIPTAAIIILSENLRHQIYTSYARGRVYVIIFSLLMFLMNILAAIRSSYFANGEAFFVFFSAIVLPIIATELLCVYLCRNFGMMSGLTFKLFLSLYIYIIPIVPNLGPYISSVMRLVLAFLIYITCSKMLACKKEDRDRFQRFSLSLASVPLVIVTAIVVSLVAGIFNYQIIAIGSNSMAPLYERGDAVLLQKLSPQEVQLGDILVFKRNGLTVTHRVVNIVEKDGTLRFETRGDANEESDIDLVPESEVVGCVRLYSKYIGYPTLWLSEIMKGRN